ncbi:MAG: hypothetical protein IBJ07_15485 [Rhizobiaceae bacterium]|nr:hypothetical protein [Rhizobiaceae bacterium]
MSVLLVYLGNVPPQVGEASNRHPVGDFRSRTRAGRLASATRMESPIPKNIIIRQTMENRRANIFDPSFERCLVEWCPDHGGRALNFA